MAYNGARRRDLRRRWPSETIDVALGVRRRPAPTTSRAFAVRRRRRERPLSAFFIIQKKTTAVLRAFERVLHVPASLTKKNH